MRNNLQRYRNGSHSDNPQNNFNFTSANTKNLNPLARTKCRFDNYNYSKKLLIQQTDNIK